MNKIYAHYDTEFNGPIPMVNDLLQLGITFTTPEGAEVNSFLVNIKERPEHVRNDDTMTRFWASTSTLKQMFQDICDTGIDAEVAMEQLGRILIEYKSSNTEVVWVAKPACVDWQWMAGYYQMYCPDEILVNGITCSKPQIGWRSKCLSSMIETYCILKGGLSDEQWNAKQAEWTQGSYQVTHNALDDARYQANWFHRFVDELEQMRKEQDDLREKVQVLSEEKQILVEENQKLSDKLRQLVLEIQ